MFAVSYDPANQPTQTEHYPTETAAQHRAHFLREGMRYSRVVVWEQMLTDDQGRVA